MEEGETQPQWVHDGDIAQWKHPCIFLYRLGGASDVGPSLVIHPDELNAQTCLNNAANRALADDAAKLLLNSLAGETQTVYFRNWEIWTRFRDTRKISPWVDASQRNWDVDILSFLTWEQTVLRNGGGALSTWFSAISFLHLVEGQGYIEGESFRIIPPIHTVNRKRGANQRLPLNPEMLEKGNPKLNLRTSASSE